MVERAVCVAAGTWASAVCVPKRMERVGSDITQSRVVSLSLSPWMHEASPVVPVPWRCWEASRVCVVGTSSVRGELAFASCLPGCSFIRSPLVQLLLCARGWGTLVDRPLELPIQEGRWMTNPIWSRPIQLQSDVWDSYH